MSFERVILVGWAEVDMNGHLRNTAYLDRCVDTRVTFFSEHGFPAVEFSRQQFGPVIVDAVAQLARTDDFTALNDSVRSN